MTTRTAFLAVRPSNPTGSVSPSCPILSTVLPFAAPPSFHPFLHRHLLLPQFLHRCLCLLLRLHLLPYRLHRRHPPLAISHDVPAVRLECWTIHKDIEWPDLAGCPLCYTSTVQKAPHIGSLVGGLWSRIHGQESSSVTLVGRQPPNAVPSLQCPTALFVCAVVTGGVQRGPIYGVCPPIAATTKLTSNSGVLSTSTASYPALLPSASYLSPPFATAFIVLITATTELSPATSPSPSGRASSSPPTAPTTTQCPYYLF